MAQGALWAFEIPIRGRPERRASAMTMNLILTSDFPSTSCPFVRDRMRRVASNPKIAWIPPFTDEGRERFARAESRFCEVGLPHIEYCDIDREADAKGRPVLDAYDIAYLSGGDPLQFRSNLQRHRMVGPLRAFADRGGLLVAASGGALQFTQNVSLFRLEAKSVDHVLLDRAQYAALGLVDYEMLPHLNRFDEGFLRRVRDYSLRIECDILALADGAALVHGDRENPRCIGTIVRIRKGQMTPVE